MYNNQSEKSTFFSPYHFSINNEFQTVRLLIVNSKVDRIM